MSAHLDALLAPAMQATVVDAIRAAEARTSGQIKVHLEERCAGGDAMAVARALFTRLALHRTARRNAVLIYVAVLDRKYAIVGDEGIHIAAGDALWQGAAARMTAALRERGLGDGLLEAVAAVGDALAASFPPEPGAHPNEIPDDLSG